MPKLKHPTERHGEHDCDVCKKAITPLYSRSVIRITLTGCTSSTADVRIGASLCSDCTLNVRDAIDKIEVGTLVKGLIGRREPL